MNTIWTEFIPIDNPNLWTLIDHKQHAIDTLSQLTKAVSENKSTEEIFNIYIQSLKQKFKYSNILVLYEVDNGWFVMHNNRYNHLDDIKLLDELKAFKQITYVKEEDTVFGEFDTVIPARYGDKISAYILIEGVHNNIIDSVSEQLRFLEAYTNIAVIAAENRRLLKQSILEKIQRNDISTAAQIQQSLIPKKFPDSRCCEFAAEYIPHNKIGGDSYDVISHPQGNAQFLSIADVSGKGVSAALLMSNFQATLKALVKYEEDYTVFANQLNQTIFEITKGERFISLFLAVINFETQDIRYINFGHNPPFLKTKDRIKKLSSGAPILGVFERLPFINVGREFWKPGSQLLAYTDGLADARNIHDERFGESRIEQFFEKYQFSDPNNLNSLLLEEVNEFKGGQKFNDDVTILTAFHKNKL